MVWKKLAREKQFIVPESIRDVRDRCSAHNVHLTPGTPLDKVKEVLQKDFEAQIGIWGSVERVAGTTGEILRPLDPLRRFLRPRTGRDL